MMYWRAHIVVCALAGVHVRVAEIVVVLLISMALLHYIYLLGAQLS